MTTRHHKAILLISTVLLGVASETSAAQESGEIAAGEIVVTARRQEERLQDVPISITVFNQQQIDDRNIVTANDLAIYTPSLSSNQRFGAEKSSFAIRGFVQDNATQPSVGVYFADVVAPRAQGGTVSGNNAPIGSLMDLQSVQVLKGPQGTLFGRNTTGGAVLLVPKRPTDHLEGYVEGSLGDYDLRRVQGVLNIPLADTFKVRLAGDRNSRDGFLRNKSGIGPSRYNDIDYFYLRLSILAELTPELENYTIASYSHAFGTGSVPKVSICDPMRVSGGGLFTALPACDQLDRQAARGDGPYDIEVNYENPFLKNHTWQVINTTKWQASDTLTVKNIASYAELRERSGFNLFGDNFISHFPAGIPFPNGVPFQYISLTANPTSDSASQYTFTEELQLQGKSSDGRLNWQAGGYFELSNPMGWSGANTPVYLNCSDPGNSVCSNPFGVGLITQSRVKSEFRSKGLYVQSTYDLTDRLSVTGGLRYTWDKMKAIGESMRLSPLPGNNFVRTCGDIVRLNAGTDATGRTIPLVVNDPAECHVELTKRSSKPTWVIDVDYKPTRDMLLYAKYARGYRQAGLNLTAIGLEGFEPEKVDTYELGAKVSFRGSIDGYFNFAAFYNDFVNQQVVSAAISNTPGISGTNPIANLGKSRIQGIEVDASATFFDSLRVDLGYTYLDTKVIDATAPEVPAGAPYSAIILPTEEGDPLTLAPKHRLSVTGTYTLPLPETIGQVSVGATFVHTDKQLATKATAPQYIFMPATDLLNINVNWKEFLGSPIDLGLFVTNVTDEFYPVAAMNGWGSAGFESLQIGAPRMWGFRVRYSFGN